MPGMDSGGGSRDAVVTPATGNRSAKSLANNQSTPNAKSAIASMATQLLQECTPEEWNNIPIPIVEGFETVLGAIKKLFAQVDNQLESQRRTQ